MFRPNCRPKHVAGIIAYYNIIKYKVCMTVLYIFILYFSIFNTPGMPHLKKKIYKVLRHEISRKGTLMGPSRRWKDDITMTI